MDVHVNAATSVDGKLSTRERRQVAISGDQDFARVDRLRADYDAVMVGVGTVLADDPALAVKDDALVDARRERGTSAQPARVVADSHARTPPDAAILDGQATSFVLVSEAEPRDHVRTLEEAGATLIVAGEERVDLPAALRELETYDVDSLLVEGGGEVIFSLFATDLVDRLTVYVGSMVIGGRDAPTLADGDGFTGEFPDLDLVGVERLDDGVLLRYDVP